MIAMTHVRLFDRQGIPPVPIHYLVQGNSMWRIPLSREKTVEDIPSFYMSTVNICPTGHTIICIFIYRHSGFVETEVISATQDWKAGDQTMASCSALQMKKKMVVTHDFKINHLLILLSILSC